MNKPIPEDKQFKVLKIDKKPSKINRVFYYLFFKGDTGKSFRTCLDPANRNFNNWRAFMKVGNVLAGISFKNYKGSWILDADSRPRLVRYEPMPEGGDHDRKA